MKTIETLRYLLSMVDSDIDLDRYRRLEDVKKLSPSEITRAFNICQMANKKIDIDYILWIADGCIGVEPMTGIKTPGGILAGMNFDAI